MNILNLLDSGNYIAVNKILARKIGLHEAILFCELISRHNYFESRNLLDKDGYFYNTVDDLENATTLTAYQQRTIINKLIKLGLIEFIVKGLPAKRYFRICRNINYNELLKIDPLKNSNDKTSNEEIKELSSQKIKEQEIKKLDGNNNNINKKKNNKKQIKTSINPLAKKATIYYCRIYQKYSPNMYQLILKRNPRKTLYEWRDTFDKMLRIDKYEYKDIIKVIDELFKGSLTWWIDTNNFRTPVKFRKNTKDGLTHFELFLYKIKNQSTKNYKRKDDHDYGIFLPGVKVIS